MWHQYEISALISWVSFHGERSNRVTKFQMFSLSRLSIASHADILLVLHHGPNCTPQIWKCAVIAHIFNRSFQQTFIEGMCDKPPPKKRFSNAVHLSLFFILVRAAEPEQCCLCNDANKDTIRKICIHYNLSGYNSSVLLKSSTENLMFDITATCTLENQGLLFSITLTCLTASHDFYLIWICRINKEACVIMQINY